VTLILAVAGIALAFPLAILFAPGRTSTTNPTIRAMAFLYIKIIRGIVDLQFKVGPPRPINSNTYLRLKCRQGTPNEILD